MNVKTNRPDPRPLSCNHSLTVELEKNGKIFSHQINNFIENEKSEELFRFFTNNRMYRFNIPPQSLEKLTNNDLGLKDIVIDPIRVLLFSSYGLLEQGEWTSSRPSDGIWVQAELLARNTPKASPICIDPNMFELKELQAIIYSLGKSTKRVIAGFSIFPEILHNESELISKIYEVLPEAVFIVGGIGAESLKYIPTKNKKWGIQHALPITSVISGNAIYELDRMVNYLYDNPCSSLDTIEKAFSEIQDKCLLYSSDNTNIPDEIIEAKITVKKYFVPQSYKDIIHPYSYNQLNTKVLNGNAKGSVDILSDNGCDQGCYYCGSPKYSIFSNKEDELNYIFNIGKNKPIISFNNNDLANDPQKMIWLCDQMVKKGMLQEKHGKMSISEYNPGLIEALARAGFKRLALGVESFDFSVRCNLSKPNFKDEHIDKSLDHMLNTGIIPEINLILFSHAENFESLKTTVDKSLYWQKKGALLFTTCGLYSIPNSMGVFKLLKERKIDILEKQMIFLEIHYPGMKDTILFPRRWKALPEIENLREYTLNKRDEYIDMFSKKFNQKLCISIQDFISISILANFFRLDAFSTDRDLIEQVDQYIRKMLKEEYIHI